MSLWANWDGLSGQYQGLIGKRDSWAANDMMWQIEANVDTGIMRIQREGIEIPFPQSDLHVRSIDEPAAAVFNGRAADGVSAASGG